MSSRLSPKQNRILIFFISWCFKLFFFFFCLICYVSLLSSLGFTYVSLQYTFHTQWSFKHANHIMLIYNFKFLISGYLASRECALSYFFTSSLSLSFSIYYLLATLTFFHHQICEPLPTWCLPVSDGSSLPDKSIDSL